METPTEDPVEEMQEEEEESAMEKADTEGSLSASLLHNAPADGEGADESAGDGEGTGGGEDDTGSTDTTPPGSDAVTPPPAQDSGTVGSAVVDLITEGLDSATAKVDRIQSQLTNELERIKYPTSVVAGDLADLCGDLYLLFPLLDDAADLSAALRESSGLIQTLLEKTDGLREELNAYEIGRAHV